MERPNLETTTEADALRGLRQIRIDRLVHKDQQHVIGITAALREDAALADDAPDFIATGNLLTNEQLALSLIGLAYELLHQPQLTRLPQ